MFYQSFLSKEQRESSFGFCFEYEEVEKSLVKFRILRASGLAFTVSLLVLLVLTPYASALSLDNVQAWKWGNNTYIGSVAAGDVDGDGVEEIVTGGVYRDSSLHWFAQLCVWTSSSLALENIQTWAMGVGSEYPLQYIESVVIGNVDGDAALEIVTGGYYYDGTRIVAQLCVWSGSTLTSENVKTWYWTSNTEITSVAVGNVDGDGEIEIVTGGYYYDGHYNAQLCTWNGATLALEDVRAWRWGSTTYVTAVAISNVDSAGGVEVVSGGKYYDGTRNVAQLCVWSGAALTFEDVRTWYWTGDTEIRSIAVGDVDMSILDKEIVTGGCYWDGAHNVAQLCTWNGGTLDLEDVRTWRWGSDTFIESVALASVDSVKGTDVITGGSYYSAGSSTAQLCVWSGASLTFKYVQTWQWGSTTYIESVAECEVSALTPDEIVTGGYYEYSYNMNAQLCVWA